MGWVTNWLRRPMAVASAVPRSATREHGYTSDAANGFWADIDDEETPELRWPLNIPVYDRMRRQDAQVISVLRAVSLPIKRTPWQIDPAGADPEVVKFVSANLGLPVKGQDEDTQTGRRRDRFSWPEHLHHALLSLPFGHSVFEQTYRIGPDGRAWLRKLGWRPPRTISRIEVAADGGLVAIEQHGYAIGEQRSYRMTVDRLVVYVNEREGGNWLGQSLLRPAYKFWLLKDRLLRVQSQTIHRNGMGVPVYEASEQPSQISDPEEYKRRADAELDSGLKIARGFRSGESAGAAVPHGASVKLLGVEGTLPDAMPPIRYYDEQIARAVLAHFLNLGTETGSWALGSTFADFFTMSLQTVGLQIADTASKHIVEDLVDINFGPDTPAPRIVFDEIGKGLAAEAIKILVDARILTPDEDLEKFARQALSLPERKGPGRGHGEQPPATTDTTTEDT
ncbi:phage portal protein family protein [Microbacterium excoecariae]|uniref:phage portal protein family protein n=1 Tax=Microbacterium excoecariae TaxID=2715210 RepID=UPI00140D9698|nr:hypothetical protein [Microbacterium excoecariae]NHI16856.1 hypothetical protein [Microbacterium excoecariae]